MGRMHYGVHKELEEAANEIIRQSLEGVTSHSAKSDVLTPWKETARLRREVYNGSGVADSSVRRGIYGRAYNPARPELNSRDGAAPARSGRGGSIDSLSAHVGDFDIGGFIGADG